MRVISVDALSELFKEPIQVFLSRLDLKCPPIIELEQNWISCNDRLPKNDNEVAVALGCNEIASGYYDGEYWYVSRDDSEYVTTSENIYGWYPLPELEENMMGGSNVPKQPNVPPMPEEEVKPITYQDCCNALLMMWMDEVLTDGEYYRIADKLNAHELKEREKRGELK